MICKKLTRKNQYSLTEVGISHSKITQKAVNQRKPAYSKTNNSTFLLNATGLTVLDAFLLPRVLAFSGLQSGREEKSQKWVSHFFGNVLPYPRDVLIKIEVVRMVHRSLFSDMELMFF